MSSQATPIIEWTETLPSGKTTVANEIDPKIYRKEFSLPAVVGGDYCSIDNWSDIDCSPDED